MGGTSACLQPADGVLAEWGLAGRGGPGPGHSAGHEEEEGRRRQPQRPGRPLRRIRSGHGRPWTEGMCEGGRRAVDDPEGPV